MKNRSTITALMPLATKVAVGFNQRKPAKRTGLLAIDLSKAFDVVRRDRLLDKVASTDLHPNLKRWMAASLVDRRVRVIYQGVTSQWKKSKMGMPQGAVLSPGLFTFFVKDLDEEAYADDFHGFASDDKLDVIANALCAIADGMDSWTKENEMLISAPKSTVTLFTPWTKEFSATLDVKIGDV